MLKHFLDLLVEPLHAPVDIKTRNVFLADATLRGIRLTIYNCNRVAAVTDEIVNCFQTPWTEECGFQLLSPSKMCTHTQCEPDDVITATGPLHLENYKFMLKHGGQTEACEWVLRMNANGFFKRPKITFSPNKNLMDDSMVTGHSKGLIFDILVCM